MTEVKRVLIVDDSATVRLHVRITLEHAGFVVTEAIDGLDAVRKLSSDFDCIVCDVHMPRMDGVRFVETMRAQPEHADIPILMLTTEGSVELIRRAKAAGAKGWVVKPFKPDQLVAALQKLTGLKASA